MYIRQQPNQNRVKIPANYSGNAFRANDFDYTTNATDLADNRTLPDSSPYAGTANRDLTSNPADYPPEEQNAENNPYVETPSERGQYPYSPPLAQDNSGQFSNPLPLASDHSVKSPDSTGSEDTQAFPNGEKQSSKSQGFDIPPESTAHTDENNSREVKAKATHPGALHSLISSLLPPRASHKKSGGLFSDIGFEELLIIGIALLVAQGENDDDILILLLILLFYK